MWCMCVYNMYVCVHYIYGCTRMCMHVCVVCVYTGVCSYEFMSWVACCSVSDCLVKSGPVAGNLDWCSLWTRYTADLKTDL